jgi:hypothetical protein
MSRVVSCRLSEGEWNAFKCVCENHSLSVGDLFHSIIIDALVDEGFDGLRCRQQEGREGATEESEAGGTATEGDR